MITEKQKETLLKHLKNAIVKKHKFNNPIYENIFTYKEKVYYVIPYFFIEFDNIIKNDFSSFSLNNNENPLNIDRFIDMNMERLINDFNRNSKNNSVYTTKDLLKEVNAEIKLYKNNEDRKKLYVNPTTIIDKKTVSINCSDEVLGIRVDLILLKNIIKCFDICGIKEVCFNYLDDKKIIIQGNYKGKNIRAILCGIKRKG